MGRIKKAIRKSLASKLIGRLWSPLTLGRVCIFTLHRFGSGDPTGMPGIDLDRLDALVGRLRRDGFRLLSLAEAVARLETPGTLAQRSVVFTVDDGYADFLGGADVFLRHGCPVTVFLTTGFVDGKHWMWWDEVEYACLHAAEGSYRPVSHGPEVRFENGSPQARVATAQALWHHCKSLTEQDKGRFVRALIDAAGVRLPRLPPAPYAPLTWDQIRDLERRGVGFAPHTVTHPILSQVGPEQAKFEIRESWRRLREEVDDPIPVFAYPNGQPGDYGQREFRIAAAAGLTAAVTTTPAYATSARVRGTPTGRYTLPRFPEPVDLEGACLAAGGFARVAARVRRQASSGGSASDSRGSANSMAI